MSNLMVMAGAFILVLAAVVGLVLVRKRKAAQAVDPNIEVAGGDNEAAFQRRRSIRTGLVAGSTVTPEEEALRDEPGVTPWSEAEPATASQGWGETPADDIVYDEPAAAYPQEPEPSLPDDLPSFSPEPSEPQPEAYDDLPREAEDTPWSAPAEAEAEPGFAGDFDAPIASEPQPETESLIEQGLPAEPPEPGDEAFSLGGPPEPVVEDAEEMVEVPADPVDLSDVMSRAFAPAEPEPEPEPEPEIEPESDLSSDEGEITPVEELSDEPDMEEAEPLSDMSAFGSLSADLPDEPEPLEDTEPYDAAPAMPPFDEESEEGDEGESEEEQGIGADFVIPRGQVDFDAMDEDAPDDGAMGFGMGALAEAPMLDPSASLSPALPPMDGDASGELGGDLGGGPLLQTKKSPKRNRAGLSGEAAQAAASAPLEIEESVSVILRRQIPVRFDEEPRSWLGGLPMMPDHVEWPRAVEPEHVEDGDKPLNFLMQIACEDLPDDLWAGLGPRSGWLCYFLNPRDGIGDDPRLFKIIHIDELGPERAPPEDLPPVSDEIYTGADYGYYRSAEDIPGVWRRWPVDLVSVPNHAYDNDGRVVVAGPEIAQEMYPGQLVLPDRPQASEFAPFSWRGALYVVDSIIRQAGMLTPPPPLNQRLRDTLLAEGYLSGLVPTMRAAERDWHENGPGKALQEDPEEVLSDRAKRERVQLGQLAEEKARSIEALTKFIGEVGNARALVERIDGDGAAFGEWLRSIPQRLDPVREAILTNDLDTPLSGDDWNALGEHLAADMATIWSAGWSDEPGGPPVAIQQHQISLFDLSGIGLDAAVNEVAADYAGQADKVGLIPQDLLGRLEPYWRHIDDHRPHRIGGFWDGIQSEPEPGEQAEVLLLQLASDSAMGWKWGEAGAYYLFITPPDLAGGNYAGAEIRQENY